MAARSRNLQTIHEHSAILIDGIQSGTLQRCPHCNAHFIVAAHGTLAEAKQSAISDIAYPRIFCVRCGRLTCGRPGCDPSQPWGCIPYESRMEHMEGKVTLYEDGIESLLSTGRGLQP